MSYTIRTLTPQDQEDVALFIRNHWTAEFVVVHDTIYYPHKLPGFVSLMTGQIVGLVTYHVQNNECEIVTLNSDCPQKGLGTLLIEAVKNKAIAADCKRLWLVTTNDNLNALRFYQKRGFVLVTIHQNAIARVRKIKPQIPLLGEQDIPIRDEIELEMMLPMNLVG
jgi:N-acetylglutamate synthase-like GNAT family acetyltransferase